MSRVSEARFVVVMSVTVMLALAAGAASAQDEELLPPSLDEDIAPEERTGEEVDAEAEPKQEKVPEPTSASQVTTEEKSGASPKESDSPPTPALATEGVPVSGNPTSGYAAPDGTRVPARGAVSSGGLARLPATGGAPRSLASPEEHTEVFASRTGQSSGISSERTA